VAALKAALPFLKGNACAWHGVLELRRRARGWFRSAPRSMGFPHCLPIMSEEAVEERKWALAQSMRATLRIDGRGNGVRRDGRLRHHQRADVRDVAAGGKLTQGLE
jgi:hypothetical protein